MAMAQLLRGYDGHVVHHRSVERGSGIHKLPVLGKGFGHLPLQITQEDTAMTIVWYGTRDIIVKLPAFQHSSRDSDEPQFATPRTRVK